MTPRPTDELTAVLAGHGWVEHGSSPLERATIAEVLDFESIARHGTTKAVAIRERFGCSEARYLQRLHRILDLPEALVVAPSFVSALRAARERRRLIRAPSVEGKAPGGARNQPLLPLEGRA